MEPVKEQAKNGEFPIFFATSGEAARDIGIFRQSLAAGRPAPRAHGRIWPSPRTTFL